MIQANKNGFLYVIDRTNCQLIAANPLVKVNWASSIDIESGRPVLTDVYKRFFAGEEVEISPSRGTNAVPIAFDPGSSLVYASTWDIPRVQKIAAPKPQVLGADSTGVTARVPDRKPGEVVGHFVAVNPLTGEKKWDVPLTDLPSSAGMLATAGGLVFTGKLTGEFLALDAATGKLLWQFQTGSSVNATAITYTLGGRQYVSIASGRGGTLANRYAAEAVPAGGSACSVAFMPCETRPRQRDPCGLILRRTPLAGMPARSRIIRTLPLVGLWILLLAARAGVRHRRALSDLGGGGPR